MKKILTIAVTLALGICVQAQAVSTNANQGTSTGKTVPVAGTKQDGNTVPVGTGNTVQTQQQNKEKNQGEDTQIQTQQENTVQTKDQTANGDKAKSNKGQLTAESHRSAVANFVQTLLSVADRDEGIGEQVRVIAQEQNRQQEQTTSQIQSVENRSKIKTFFFGTDCKNLGELRSNMVQTQNQIAQLNRLVEKAQNDEEKATLETQIQNMEQEQARIQAFIVENESQFSLLGWVAKFFNKY